MPGCGSLSWHAHSLATRGHTSLFFFRALSPHCLHTQITPLLCFVVLRCSLFSSFSSLSSSSFLPYPALLSFPSANLILSLTPLTSFFPQSISPSHFSPSHTWPPSHQDHYPSLPRLLLFSSFLFFSIFFLCFFLFRREHRWAVSFFSPARGGSL